MSDSLLRHMFIDRRDEETHLYSMRTFFTVDRKLWREVEKRAPMYVDAADCESTPGSVLIVDEDLGFGKELRHHLEQAGFKVKITEFVDLVPFLVDDIDIVLARGEDVEAASRLLSERRRGAEIPVLPSDVGEDAVTESVSGLLSGNGRETKMVRVSVRIWNDLSLYRMAMSRDESLVAIIFRWLLGRGLLTIT